MLLQHVIEFVLLFTDISTSIFPSLTFLSILNLFQLEFSTAGFRRALFYQFLSRTAFDYLWKWRKQSYRRDNKSASNWPLFIFIFFYLQMNTFRKLIWSLGLTYYSNSCSLLSSPPMFSVTLSDSLLALGCKGYTVMVMLLLLKVGC